MPRLIYADEAKENACKWECGGDPSCPYSKSNGITHEQCEFMRAIDECETIDAVPVDIPTKQTNADRIRAMTDEELATFIGGIFTMERDVCGCYDPHMVVTQEPRAEIRDFSDMIEWLKEKVTE